MQITVIVKLTIFLLALSLGFVNANLFVEFGEKMVGWLTIRRSRPIKLTLGEYFCELHAC
jgi:hypothetical protein